MGKKKENSNVINFCDLVVRTDKDFLNLKECAVWLGISKQLMRQLSYQPDFPCVRFGRRIVICKQQLLEWWSKHNNISIKY